MQTDDSHPSESTYSAVDEEVAPNKHIIDVLFDFVRTDEELNSVLCGYFTKFLNSLMNRNRKGFFAYVHDPKNRVIESLIKHAYNRSISDVLIKVLYENMDNPEKKKGYILSIINSMRTQEYEGKLNSAIILSEVIEAKHLWETFKSEEVNLKLFELLESDDDLTVRAALTFLNVLYKKFPFYERKGPGRQGSDDFADTYLPPTGRTDEAPAQPAACFSAIEAIIDRGSRDRLEQQYGATIEPFGATRMQAAKLITNIIAQGNTQHALSLAP
mmetsp:Transcript_25780/g.29693  ORF Transcript_25780/g.29693 Transcript_25780/m.29693 type:complete len:272 (-) Transcript_25780:1171-1986(-)